MWSPMTVRELRERLGFDTALFAKLLSVDTRSVRRWESGHARPTGTAAAVMSGIEESLNKAAEAGAPNQYAAIRDLCGRVARVGGLSYLLVTLIDTTRAAPEPRV